MTDPMADLAWWVAAYREESLQPEERQALRRHLEADQNFRSEFARALIDATQLDVHYAGESLAYHRSCIRDAIALDRSSQRLREVRRVQDGRRRHARPRRRRVSRRRAMAATISAAGLAVALALLVLAVPLANDPPIDHSPWRLATVHSLDGAARLDGVALQVGTPPATEGLLEVAGRVELALADGTRVQVVGPASLHLGEDAPLRLDRGHLMLDVAPQQGPRFTIDGPHGPVSVLGTRFGMSTDPSGTTVALAEGLIATGSGVAERRWQAPSQFRLSGGQAMALTDLSISAGNGRITDPDWRLEADPDALTGKAWVLAPQPADLWQNQEVSDRALAEAHGIELVLPALAGVPYRLWIRTSCDATGPRRLRHDTIAVAIPDGRVLSRPPVPEGRTFPEGPQLVSFSGSGAADGYVWLGGWADHRLADQREAVVIQFENSGLQRLRLISYEGPVRVDSIRLVTEQGRDP